MKAMLVDKDTVKRAKDALRDKGVVLADADVRDILVAAETEPPPKIPVTVGMIDVGRETWRNNPSAAPHVLLPLIYRAMEQQRRDENP
jgi:hypothetical protein